MSNRIMTTAADVHTTNVERLEGMLERLSAWLTNPCLPQTQQEYLTERYFTVRDQLKKLKTA